MKLYMKNIFILGGLILLAVGVYFFLSSDRSSEPVAIEETYVTGEPLDLVLQAVNDWREIQATTSETTTTLESFISTDLFSVPLRATLMEQDADLSRDPQLDVIYCQAVVPPRLVGRMILNTETEAQLMIFGRGLENPSPYQAIVTMTGNGEGAWSINNIECAQGEVAPDVEFTFDNEGYLLKSVPPPYQSGSWHVVFEQDGQMGYVAPLVFDAESICIESSGEQAVCEPDNLVEPILATIRGDMTESGVTVRQIIIN